MACFQPAPTRCLASQIRDCPAREPETNLRTPMATLGRTSLQTACQPTQNSELAQSSWLRIAKEIGINANRRHQAKNNVFRWIAASVQSVRTKHCSSPAGGP